MTQPLDEMKEYRTRDTYGGPGYTGFRDTRIFRCPLGDVATHEAGAFAHGSVLPEKWGGVATSTPLDPTLHKRYHRQSKETRKAEIVTEWVTISPRSPSIEDDWGPYETSTSGAITGATHNFYGERICVISDAMVSSWVAKYDPDSTGAGLWPGTSGVFAAWQSQYRITNMPERVGCKLLTLIYTDPLMRGVT